MSRTLEEEDLEAARGVLTAGGWTPPTGPDTALRAVIKRHEKLAGVSFLHQAVIVALSFTLGAAVALSPYVAF